MVNATLGYLREGELLYIATDEDDGGFFEPFRERSEPFRESSHPLPMKIKKVWI